MENQSSYLELMKKTLLFELWDDLGTPLEWKTYKFGKLEPLVDGMLNALKKTTGVRLLIDRKGKHAWPTYAHTMTKRAQLDNVEQLIRSVIDRKIEGDLIECGVWRGGTCIFMRACLEAMGAGHRVIYVADSFQGLPKPAVIRHEEDTLYKNKELAIGVERVKANIRRYGFDPNNFRFVQGFFDKTLHDLKTGKLAIARLDGDLYTSTKTCLEELYHRVSVGGFIIIDDFFLEGCKEAVLEFQKKNNIRSEIIRIDELSAYWMKE